jgi:hypothetical protein
MAKRSTKKAKSALKRISRRKLSHALSKARQSPRGRKLDPALQDAWMKWELARGDRKPTYQLLAVQYWIFGPHLREFAERNPVDSILLGKQILSAKGEKYPTIALRNLTERVKKGIKRLHRQSQERFS